MKMALLAVLSWMVLGQDAVLQSRVVTTVRAAMTPALPFPASDDAGSLPATNDTEAFWMVKPLGLVMARLSADTMPVVAVPEYP